MVYLNDMREGSIVVVRGDKGHGPQERGRVDIVCQDVKHGYPGIDYTLLDSNGNPTNRMFWAYLDQVDRVVKY